MAYIQRTTPPPNKIEMMSVKSFTGGLNNRGELIADNESVGLKNMMFRDADVMEKRFGSEAYDDLKLDKPIIFLDEYKPYDDVPQLVRATDTAFYMNKDWKGGSGKQIRGVNYMGKYFYTNDDDMLVYGKFPVVTTTYEKVIGTPVSGYTSFYIVNPPAGYTPLGTTHKQGVTVYDYSKKEVWYEPCQLEMEDPYKNANAVPQYAFYFVVHQDRLFVAGLDKDNDNVFISDVGNPYYFPSTMPIQMPPNSDKILGLKVYDNAVLVGREYDIHMIYGETNNPDLGFDLFRLKRLNTHTGIANQDAMDYAHNYLFFVGSDGNMYSLGTTRMDERLVTTTILSRQLDLFKDPINLTREDMKTATSGFHEDYWYVSVKDKVLIYSYRHQAWTMWKGLNARCFYNLNGKLIWGNDSGYVAQHTKNYLDFGEPYEAYWASKIFDQNASSNYKQYREFFIVGHTYDDFQSDIRVTFEVDYVDVKIEEVIQNQIAKWGRSKWGDRFITRNINASVPFVIGRRARGIRFILKNGYDVEQRVPYQDELAILPNRHDGMFVYASDTNKYFLFTKGEWKEMKPEDVNQPMRVYQVNGEYEIRGKR